jgi:hypothetical protein
MLDQVKASAVDTALETMVYAVGELLKPKTDIPSYTVSSTINDLRNLRSWVLSNKLEGVALSDMDKVLKDIEQLIIMLEDARIHLALEDKRQIYNNSENDEHDYKED